VFLSERDRDGLSRAVGLGWEEFEAVYCRWVRVETGGAFSLEQLSLKEKPNNDCVFWNNGCTVYESRPLQCRSFPFWELIVADADMWERCAEDCPGMGKGVLHAFEEIEGFLEQGKAQVFIERRRG